MIHSDYCIDDSWHDSGGYCDFLPIKGHSDIGFKSFKKKAKAIAAWKNQKKLSKFDLAPEPITNICKIAYNFDPCVLQYLSSENTISSWGFVTEKADPINTNRANNALYKKIQYLVDTIWEKTRMKFWDCHENNVGYVKRGRTKKLVCIDTGKESFDSYSNAWGFQEPGPKCPYCLKYQCRCSE